MKSKATMTEEDIKNKYITPAIVGAGWDLRTQVHFEHSFTDGRIIMRGNMTTRAKQKRADYLLMHKSNYPLAIVEAKDNKHPVGGSMQQALEYAEILDIPYAYSSNGDAFVEHNRLTGEERTIQLHEFPSHDVLWRGCQ